MNLDTDPSYYQRFSSYDLRHDFHEIYLILKITFNDYNSLPEGKATGNCPLRTLSVDCKAMCTVVHCCEVYSVHSNLYLEIGPPCVKYAKKVKSIASTNRRPRELKFFLGAFGPK